MEKYDTFIVAIKTNFNKVIAFYIPIKFQEEKDWINTYK